MTAVLYIWAAELLSFILNFTYLFLGRKYFEYIVFDYLFHNIGPDREKECHLRGMNDLTTVNYGAQEPDYHSPG
jgi:hypothetical protein